jgi:hypothetical protein
MSGTNVITTATVASGLFIVNDSGVRVIVQSGLYVLINSGLTVNIGSGVGVLVPTHAVTTSISGNAVFVSGLVGIIGTPTVVTSISGQAVFISGVVDLKSGVIVLTQAASGEGLRLSGLGIVGAITTNISGQSVSAPSSAPLYVTNTWSSPIYIASGVNVVASVAVNSGLFVINDSGVRVVVQSGLYALINSGLQVNIGSGIGVLVPTHAVTTSISGNAVFISGMVGITGTPTVNITSGQYVNIGSGVGVTASLAWASTNVVSIGSGVSFQMSGAKVITTIASGLFIINDSGVRVVIQSGVVVLTQSASGEGLRLSGLGIVGAITANISGQAVIAGGQYRPVSVTVESGQTSMWPTNAYGEPYMMLDLGYSSGLAVNIGSGVGVNVAGTVSLLSGAWIEVVSGVTSQVESGQALYVKMSGVNATLSGIYVNATVSISSGLGVMVDKPSLSGLNIHIATSGQSYPLVGSRYEPVTVSYTSGAVVPLTSLQDGRLRTYIYTADISGQSVIAQSGLGVIVQASGVVGQMISGQAMYVQMSGVNARISGIGVVIDSNPSSGIRARAILKVHNLSGGVALVSGIIHSVTLKSLSGAIYVGGTGAIDMPYSGYGLLLGGGEAVTFDVGNFNLVKVMAAVSGDSVSYAGIV